MSHHQNISPQFISAVSALIALISSLFIYFFSRRREKPTERPILYIKEIISDKTSGKIRFIFNNFGKSPASNIIISMGTAPISDPSAFSLVKKPEEYNNKIYPGTDSTLSVPYNTGMPRFLFFRVKYISDLKKKKKYMEDFWYISEPGYSISQMSAEQIIILSPFVNNQFSQTE